MRFSEVETTTVGEGVIVRLERIVLRAPDGSLHDRDVVRHPGGVAVLAIADDRTWLVRQYRVAVDRFVLEIPAGKQDREDESPRELAERELAEELGLQATRWESLGVMDPSPGYSDERIHLFAATGIVAVERRPDGVEEDEAEIVDLSLDEALTAVDDGTITDAKTQVALLRWARRNQ